MWRTWRAITSLVFFNSFSVAADDLQHIRARRDRGQGIAQLVGQHGKELVLSATRIQERLLRLTSLGDVAEQQPRRELSSAP